VCTTPESKGDGIGGAPPLEPRVMDAVEGKGGDEGNEVPQKCMRMDDKLMSPSRGLVYQSKLMLSPFHLHIHACLDHPFPPS
jgi:hypothetical protein